MDATIPQTTEQKPNPQLYANSRLAELFAEEPATGDAFFNPLDPNLAILHEKPQHRLLILLKMSGRTNREIAAESGYSEAWLSQVFRQPWAQAEMSRVLAESGKDGIAGLLKSEVIPSIMTLVELRDGDETPSAVRKAACDSLLDRYLGKPAQHVDVVEHKDTLSAETVAEVDQELERLRAEEKQLLGHN